MLMKSYSTFVRATSPAQCPDVKVKQNSVLSGAEARRIYLDEVKNSKTATNRICALETKRKIVNKQEVPLSNKDLFMTVQNNDVDTLKCILDRCPDKINVVDQYGWSLLMIACQANSLDTVKVLLKRGIDMSMRDKAGNSARSLVIKNKNYILADILLSYKQANAPINLKQIKIKEEVRDFMCKTCNKLFPNREEHLSSTLHNISASKGKKIPANYIIPESNIGYQLMLKGGWDKQSGLGRDGSGKLYPIKTVQKIDKKGLGCKQKCGQKAVTQEDYIKHKYRKKLARNNQSNKSFEINFRRQFY